jgi:hypothetical protein
MPATREPQSFFTGPVNRQPQNGNRQHPKQYPKKTCEKNMTGEK